MAEDVKIHGCIKVSVQVPNFDIESELYIPHLTPNNAFGILGKWLDGQGALLAYRQINEARTGISHRVQYGIDLGPVARVTVLRDYPEVTGIDNFVSR